MFVLLCFSYIIITFCWFVWLAYPYLFLLFRREIAWLPWFQLSDSVGYKKIGNCLIKAKKKKKERKKQLNHSAIIIKTLTSHERFDVSNHRQCRQFVQKLLQTGSKATLKSLHHWSSVRGIHQSPLDSPHEGSVMLKVFPCHDVIMCRDILYYFGTPNDAWVIVKNTKISHTICTHSSSYAQLWHS